MSVHHQVALLGFSAFERDTLAVCLRLASSRTHAYEVTAHPFDADLLIADADMPEVVQEVAQLGRSADTLHVGQGEVPNEPVARIWRPISALRVHRALDALAQRRCQRITPAPPQAADPLFDSVLLASDSRAELAMLQELLEPFRLQIACVASGEEVVMHCRLHHPSVVILGSFMSGLDPFQTCLQIKQPQSGSPHPAPLVVLLAQRLRPIDVMRAEYAGCDACFAQPLQQQELRQLLAPLRRVEVGFAPTLPLAG